MKTKDADLFGKILSLPPQMRADLLEFLGVSSESAAPIKEIENAISKSFTLKARIGSGRNN
jgi:hypothetical protein